MINLNKMKIISIICACFFSENIGVTCPNILLDWGLCECDRSTELAGYVSCGPFCTTRQCVVYNRLADNMNNNVKEYGRAYDCAWIHETHHMEQDDSFWNGCGSKGMLMYNTLADPPGKNCRLYAEEVNAYLEQLNCLVDCINDSPSTRPLNPRSSGCKDSFDKYKEYYEEQRRLYFNKNCNPPTDPPLPPESELKQIIPRSY